MLVPLATCQCSTTSCHTENPASSLLISLFCTQSVAFSAHSSAELVRADSAPCVPHSCCLQVAGRGAGAALCCTVAQHNLAGDRFYSKSRGEANWFLHAAM